MLSVQRLSTIIFATNSVQLDVALEVMHLSSRYGTTKDAHEGNKKDASDLHLILHLKMHLIVQMREQLRVHLKVDLGVYFKI